MGGEGLMISREFKGHDREGRGQKVSLQVHPSHVYAWPGKNRAADSRLINVYMKNIFSFGSLFFAGGWVRFLWEDRGKETGFGISLKRPGGNS